MRAMIWSARPKKRSAGARPSIPHVGTPMVVVLDERGQAALCLVAILEMETLPQLALERADGAFNLAATAWAVGAADDVIDQLGLQHAAEVAVLGEGDERSAPVGAHGLGLSVASHRGPERRRACANRDSDASGGRSTRCLRMDTRPARCISRMDTALGGRPEDLSYYRGSTRGPLVSDLGKVVDEATTSRELFSESRREVSEHVCASLLLLFAVRG